MKAERRKCRLPGSTDRGAGLKPKLPERRMSQLVFPELVRIQLIEWVGCRSVPFRRANVALGIRTFARRKNDYHLGPFFSDPQGVVTITRERLEIAAEAELESGIMDYGGVEECFPLVEIKAWTWADVRAAIEGRRLWGLLGRESRVWGSAEALITLLRRSENRRLRPDVPALRDEWDGSREQREYVYAMIPDS